MRPCHLGVLVNGGGVLFPPAPVLCIFLCVAQVIDGLDGFPGAHVLDDALLLHPVKVLGQFSPVVLGHWAP